MWHTMPEIAQLLGRTPAAVAKLRTKLGIRMYWHARFSGPRSHHLPEACRRTPTRRSWTPGEWHKALKLSERVPLQEAARILGRSRLAVAAKFAAEGVKYGQGRYTVSFVARLCGCSVSLACRVAREIGLRRYGKRSGTRYMLSPDEVRQLVKALRPGRLYLCDDL